MVNLTSTAATGVIIFIAMSLLKPFLTFKDDTKRTAVIRLTSIALGMLAQALGYLGDTLPAATTFVGWETALGAGAAAGVSAILLYHIGTADFFATTGTPLTDMKTLPPLSPSSFTVAGFDTLTTAAAQAQNAALTANYAADSAAAARNAATTAALSASDHAAVAGEHAQAAARAAETALAASPPPLSPLVATNPAVAAVVQTTVEGAVTQ